MKTGKIEATKWTSKTPLIEEWEEKDMWALRLIIYKKKNPLLDLK